MEKKKNYHQSNNFDITDKKNVEQENCLENSEKGEKNEELKSIQEEKIQKEIKEKGFNYSSLKPIIDNADKKGKKQNVILLSTGSYNPIHRMHLEILNIAYKFLLSLKDFNVLCAFISPSADSYVKYKMSPLIPFEKRCEMVKTAIEEYKSESDLKIFLHTWEGSKEEFIDFPYVIKEIQKELKKYKIKLFYVCGLDLFSKCRYVFF